MRWLLFSLGLTFVSLASSQSPELEQAIQVVREWLKDPTAPVRFRLELDNSIDLFGPENIFVFEAPGYSDVDVDLNTMTVVGWLEEYEPQPVLPLLSDKQVKDIGINYARNNFPNFNEFKHWDIDLRKYRDKETGTWDYKVVMEPFFINNQGQKIPYLATGVRVNIDPYTGYVYGFGYAYMPMTLTDLTPIFSPSEAKVLIEKAFKDLGAAEAVAVMSSPDFETPDGLVIGATQTSGLRLAYAFDYVITVGAPGYEDELGDAENPACLRAAIDAHTGELFYCEYWLGAAGEKEKRLLYGQRKGWISFWVERGWVFWVSLTLGVMALVMSLVALVAFRRSRH